MDNKQAYRDRCGESFCADDMRWWNQWNPTLNQFTKDEFMAMNPSYMIIQDWNTNSNNEAVEL